MFKQVVWKASAFVLWDVAAGFPFAHMPWWKEFLYVFIIVILFDLLVWGVKEEFKK